MVDYSYLSSELLSAVRSLTGYGRFAQFLRRNRCRIDQMRFAAPSYSAIGLLFKNSVLCDFATRKDIRQFWLLLDRFGIDCFLEGCKAVHNAYMRTTRVKQRLQKILNTYHELYFVTFTIRDDFIADFTSDVKGTCALCRDVNNKVSSDWVFNTDYGDKRGRLHLHACVSADLDDVKMLKKYWIFGSVHIERVRDGDLDMRKIARYQTKLARHATKESAFNVVYSRKKKNG